MIETALVEIKKLRDFNGNPVCHNWFYDVCVFIEMKKYGRFTCRISNVSRDEARTEKENATEWNGRRPHKKCPVWHNKTATEAAV